MKTKRKVLSVLMTLAMVVSMIPAFGVIAQAEEAIQISWNQNEIIWTEVPGTTHYSISVQWIAADGLHSGETFALTFYPEGKKGFPDLTIDYDGHSYGSEGTIEKNGKCYILKTKESPLKLVDHYIETDQYIFQIYSYNGERTGKNLTWTTGAEINSGSLDKVISTVVSTVNFENFTLPTNGGKYTSDVTVSSDFPGKITHYAFVMFRKDVNGMVASAGENVGFGVYVDLDEGYSWAADLTAYLNGKPQEMIIHNDSMGTEYGFLWTFNIGYTDKIQISSQSPETVEYVNGEDVTLYVNATGATGYQWSGSNATESSTSSGGAKQKYSRTEIAGATSNTYTITKADSSLDGSQYRCTLSCSEGTVYSNIFTLKMVDKKTALVNPFEDVYESDSYYDAVLWAYYASPQVTNGMDTTHFGPNLTVTRAQAVTFLWRSQGCPKPSSTVNPFVDVPSTEYYYKPVLWAVENNITKGTTDTTFDPNDTLTTAHMITFLYRTKNPGKDGWNGEAATWAADSNGKPFGVDIAVDNKTNCPRCNVVQFLYKLSK